MQKIKIKIYENVIGSCTVRVRNLVSHFKGEHRLRVFENRVLRRIFGPKRDEDVSRKMRWAGHVASMGDGRGVYRVFVERLEDKNYWEDLGVGVMITLSWTLGR
jgi:hypothetical protein